MLSPFWFRCRNVRRKRSKRTKSGASCACDRGFRFPENMRDKRGKGVSGMLSILIKGLLNSAVDV
jgi:hypothetical protein